MSATAIPPEFRAMLGLDKPERPTLAPVVALHVAGTDAATRYGNAALTGECDRVATAPDGTRNDTLNRAAFNLAQLVEQNILTHDTARDQLRNAALMSGLAAHEIDLTLNSAFKGAIVKPRATVQLVDTPDLPSVHILEDTPAPEGEVESVEADSPEEHLATIKRLFPTLDWAALWADDTEEEWVLEPLIPARRLVALFSAPKVGKSLLMLEVAVAVSQGIDVLGAPTAQQEVLYVDFENDPRGDIKERLQSMGVKPEQLDHLHYMSFPTLAKLDTERGGIELVAIAKAYECTVIIIDTISRAVKGEENENDTWLDFYRCTGLLLKQAKIACIRLDHSGKDVERGMRGGSAKYGDVDAVWKMTSITDDTYQLQCTDNRLPIGEKTIVFKREVNPYLHSQVQAEGRLAAWKAQTTAALEAMDALGLPNDIGRDKARAALKSAGKKAANSPLEAAIRERKQRVSLTDWSTE